MLVQKPDPNFASFARRNFVAVSELDLANICEPIVGRTEVVIRKITAAYRPRSATLGGRQEEDLS